MTFKKGQEEVRDMHVMSKQRTLLLGQSQRLMNSLYPQNEALVQCVRVYRSVECTYVYTYESLMRLYRVLKERLRFFFQKVFIIKVSQLVSSPYKHKDDQSDASFLLYSSVQHGGVKCISHSFRKKTRQLTPLFLSVQKYMYNSNKVPC